MKNEDPTVNALTWLIIPLALWENWNSKPLGFDLRCPSARKPYKQNVLFKWNLRRDHRRKLCKRWLSVKKKCSINKLVAKMRRCRQRRSTWKIIMQPRARQHKTHVDTGRPGVTFNAAVHAAFFFLLPPRFFFSHPRFPCRLVFLSYFLALARLFMLYLGAAPTRTSSMHRRWTFYNLLSQFFFIISTVFICLLAFCKQQFAVFQKYHCTQ